MNAMDKETQAELDRLEREIWLENKDLTEIMADDVLKDLDALLNECAADHPEEKESVLETMVPLEVAFQNTAEEKEERPDDTEEETDDEHKKDGLTIGLLITASTLCIGIIGVMIYWLENFL